MYKHAQRNATSWSETICEEHFRALNVNAIFVQNFKVTSVVNSKFHHWQVTKHLSFTSHPRYTFHNFNIIILNRPLTKLFLHLNSDTLSVHQSYRGAGKSLARPGRKEANVSVRMAWFSFGALPCRKRNLMTARVSCIRCADKSLARPGRKQANVSVRMAYTAKVKVSS